MVDVSHSPVPIHAVMATLGRVRHLREVSLPSIQAQRRLPEKLTIICDMPVVPSAVLAAVSEVLPELQSAGKVSVITNQFAPGMAGALNTGLDFVVQTGSNPWIAILDDDDSWDANHLESCASIGENSKAHLVLSGLRLVVDGQPIDRALPCRSWSLDDFLLGNPGWQGSNTFVRLQKLVQAGGFRDGLQSLNDRDLAIRILSLADLDIVFTKQWTATWYCRTRGDTLSSIRSPAKITGIRQFLAIYGDRMTESGRSKFNKRCQTLFGIAPTALNETNAPACKLHWPIRDPEDEVASIS